jgi:ABC-type branched-subunit amino acid transport system substrate-binding protein
MRPQTVRIGFFGPDGSAPDADLGQQMREGVRLALEQANDAGGYEDIPFELVTRVDTGLWGSSANEMVAFKYQDDVLAVIGSVDGANTHIALRVALKVQMPMVNTAATDPTLTETNIPWLLRCMADDRQQGYALAHHIFNRCGIKRVVAFRVNDRYGRTGIAEFRDAARRLKCPLRLELRWEPGDRQFTAQLDRIAQTDPEAVVLWGNASDTAAIVREIRKRKMPLEVFGCDRLVAGTFLSEAGEAAEGVVAVATYDPTRGESRLEAFTEAFRHRFNHEPEAFAAHAYDGAKILIDAVRKAGLNRARIRDVLYEYTHYDGVTGSIDFDTTLNDIGPVYIATVKGGRFIYEEADSASEAQSGRAPASGRASPPVGARPRSQRSRPYRVQVQSPPAVRSPARASRGAPAVYRLGCFLPLDASRNAAVRGAQMALAEDAARHPDQPPIELLVRDARGAWGENSSSLVDLVLERDVLALIGSTERRGTHLAEMLAAKMHFPVLTLCGGDPTITQIPLPWIFSVAPASDEIDPDFARRYSARYGARPDAHAALGYDAAALAASGIRGGADTRVALRDALASGAWNRGATGVFAFDALGTRINAAQGGIPASGGAARPETPSTRIAGRANEECKTPKGLEVER